MLYHISLDPNLPTHLFPRVPEPLRDPWGIYKVLEDQTVKRICFSTDLAKCLIAIFPNLPADIIDQPYVDFYVYVPVNFNPDFLVSNDTIVKNRWVSSAHLTDEVWLTCITEVKLKYKVRYYLDHKEKITYYPYNNPKAKPIKTNRPTYVNYEVLFCYL